MILSCTTLTSNGAAVAGAASTAAAATAEAANGNNAPQPLLTSTPTHLLSERQTTVHSPQEASSPYRQQPTVSNSGAATLHLSYSNNGNIAIGQKQKQRQQQQQRQQLQEHFQHYVAHRSHSGSTADSKCSAGEKANSSISLTPGNYIENSIIL